MDRRLFPIKIIYQTQSYRRAQGSEAHLGVGEERPDLVLATGLLAPQVLGRLSPKIICRGYIPQCNMLVTSSISEMDCEIYVHVHNSYRSIIYV